MATKEHKAFTDAQVAEYEAAVEAGVARPAWATNFVWSPDGGYRFMDADEVKAADDAAKADEKARTDREAMVAKAREKGTLVPPAPRVVG